MTRERNVQLILVGGDILALLLFVFVGQADHELVNPENPLGGVILSGAPFLAAWLVTAFLIGAYRVEVLNPRVMLARSLIAWLIALPIGIALRAFLLNLAVIPFLFLLAAYTFGGLFVLGWRMAFVILMQWRKRESTGK